jgi:mono/diheme cytochrome c family protein
MHDQPTRSAMEASSFFADNAASRPPVAGTVPRGELRDDELLYRGTMNGEPADMFPFPIDDAVMARGQDGFNAFCSPCHGRTGRGDGIVVQRGFTRPPDLTDEGSRSLPAGHLFNVITNGFGAMPDHAAQVKVRDRWAITAYLRALQLSASASIADVPAAERSRLESGQR